MRRNPSKSNQGRGLRCLLPGSILALWALPCAAGLSAAAATSAAVQINESETLSITLDLFPDQSVVPGSLEVVTPPAIGTVTPLPGEDTFLYEPGPRFGMEYVTFLARSAKSLEQVILDLGILVFPSALPIYGSFSPGAESSYGLYHLEEMYFQLCEPYANPDGVPDCGSYRVQGAGPGLYPVYGDWDGDLWHLPSLFDSGSGTLHRLAWSSDGQSLWIDQSVGWWAARGALPVAGDWSTGVDSLVIVQPSGQIVEIQEPFGANQITTWDAAVPAFDDDAFRLPFVWRTEVDPDLGSGSLQAVAVLDSFLGTAMWWAPQDGEIKFGTSSASIAGLGIPILGRTPIVGKSFTYLGIEEDGLGIRFEVLEDTGSRPNTLQITFPSDPPGP